MAVFIFFFYAEEQGQIGIFFSLDSIPVYIFYFKFFTNMIKIQLYCFILN